jgi:hypothetical protein
VTEQAGHEPASGSEQSPGSGHPDSGDQSGRERPSGRSCPPVRTGQSGRSGQSGQSGRPGPQGSDLIGDLQRWLLRSGARNMRREIGGQVRRKLSGGRTEPRDVWDTATTEPPPDLGEAPECAWCPVCQAARRLRETGPGFGSQLSGAGGAVAAAVQAALNAFEGVMSRTGPGPDRPPGGEGSGRDRAAPPGAAQPGAGGPGDAPDHRG